MAIYEWEHCSVLKLISVAGKCKKIFFLVSNGNLTLVLHTWVVAIKTNESVAIVQSQNEQTIKKPI